MLTCRSLRNAIFGSTALLFGAWLMELSATNGLLPSVTTGYIGFILLMASAAILGLTLVLSLLPANAVRLSGCEH